MRVGVATVVLTAALVPQSFPPRPTPRPASPLPPSRGVVKPTRPVSAQQRADAGTRGFLERSSPRPEAPSRLAQGAPAEKPSKTRAVDENQGETPSRTFERIFAPIYIPPAIAKQRPDLQEPPRPEAPSRVAQGAPAEKPSKTRAVDENQ